MGLGMETMGIWRHFSGLIEVMRRPISDLLERESLSLEIGMSDKYHKKSKRDPNPYRDRPFP